MKKDRPAACALDSKRVFGQYVEPEVFDDGQYIRQHHGTLRGIQSQLCLVSGISWWLVKRNLELCLSVGLRNESKMIKSFGRGEVFTRRPAPGLPLLREVLSVEGQVHQARSALTL